MEHAGVKEEDISYFKLKLDTDDGIVEYDIKFYVGNTEYEYDIDAVTGTIRSLIRNCLKSTIRMAPRAAVMPPLPRAPSVKPMQRKLPWNRYPEPPKTIFGSKPIMMTEG